MLVFTNYLNVKDETQINQLMKDLLNKYKEENKNVKVVDCERILSIDTELVSPNQKKILSGSDFVLRRIVDLDIVLNKVFNNNDNDVFILTNSWTDIIDTIIDLLQINTFGISELRQILIELNEKMRLYFDLVADSCIKSIIKYGINIGIETYYFNKNKSLIDKFMFEYINFTSKYEEEIHGCLIEYVHKQTGFSDHRLFKENIKLIDIN